MTLLRLVQTGHQESVEAAILDLNSKFSASTTAADPFRLWALARQLDCYLVAVDMPDRERKARRARRHWADAVRAMEDLKKSINGAFPFVGGLKDYDLQGLANYSTAKSNKEPFLASVALFLMNATETNTAALLAMQPLLPTSEREMLAALADAWLGPLERGETEGVTGHKETRPSSAASQVDLSQPFEPSMLEDFGRFFKKFAIERDGHAHFICYRNGASQPHQVLKSFLAIKAPTASEPHYTFAHYYEVPSLGEQSRVSRGHVVVLESGAYLVGGHRPLADEVRTDPAGSLEVIVLPWTDVKVPESLLQAITLTSNYDGEPIVSRMAIRATSVQKYADLSSPLDTIELDKLLSSIESDFSDEEKTGKSPFTRTSPQMQLRRILSFTNNISGRDTALTFRLIGSPGEKALDVQQVLDDTFGTEEDPRYVADELADFKFDFWRDVRFGPLSV
jgi:hypothetical protein